MPLRCECRLRADCAACNRESFGANGRNRRARGCCPLRCECRLRAEVERHEIKGGEEDCA